MLLSVSFQPDCNVQTLFCVFFCFLLLQEVVKHLSTRQCSVAQRAELSGLSSKPSNKADSCVNKLAFFRTCSVYLYYFLAMILKTNSSATAVALLRICHLSVHKLLALLKNSKQGAILAWLSAKPNGCIMITGLFPVVKIFV